jgi:adhesin HecA-like repeat protein
VATAGPAAASSGASAVAAVLNPVVYNHYYEVDNSITNNIEADGNVNVVIGDGNVTAGDDLDNTGGNIQTGDGVQIDDSVIDDSNINSGDDVQQAIDQSTNVEDSFNEEPEPEPQVLLNQAEEAPAPDGAEDAAV